MNRIIDYSTKLKNKIVPHLCDRRQYEINYKNKYLSDILDKNIEFLQKHREMIGKEVYQQKKFNAYSLTPSDDVFNPTEDFTIVLTTEIYDQLFTDYIKLQIYHYTDYLVNQKLTTTGSHVLLNIEFGWSIDCIQQLIKFYQTLLNKIT